MRILLLTQVLPYPPDSGPKVKTLNLLKFLAQRHQVTLVSFIRGDQSKEARQLEKYCESVHVVPIKRSLLRDLWHVFLSLMSHRPFLMVRDDQAAMRCMVDRLSAQNAFDVVHADQLNMAQYALRLGNLRKFLDTHNASWLLYKRLAETKGHSPQKWLLNREWRLLWEYEGCMVREFDTILAVSEFDKAALAQTAGESSKITVVPIGIDVEDLPLLQRRSSTENVVFVGTLYWWPNIDGVLWFIREVYSRIRAKRPQVTFDVIGARPPRQILRLEKEETGIKVRGYVEKLGPYLERARAFVVPLRAGSGMRVKILNAMSSGVPIVSTSLGCEGIVAEHGRHLLMADTAEDFAENTVRLLENPRLGDQLAQNARKLVESTYDYRLACQTIERLYVSPAEKERLGSEICQARQ